MKKRRKKDKKEEKSDVIRDFLEDEDYSHEKEDFADYNPKWKRYYWLMI